MAELLDRLASAVTDRYAVEGELGSGGMATVYLARDLKHPRRVAIKVLKPEIAAANGPERFLREIRVTAGLIHPHILPLLDSGQFDGLPYFVMPFVEGESLYERLKREGQLPIDDAIRITREVADALAMAHAHGIVHRDIKPANILLEEGHAVVADFGIGLAIRDAVGGPITSAGLAIGTPGYMSPEQATGQPNVDYRSDVYALGCVLYEMLVGEPPFTGPTAQAIIARQLSMPVFPVAISRDTVPAAVDRVVRRALARLPADRFQTAAALSAALDQAVSEPTRHGLLRWRAARHMPRLVQPSARRARSLVMGLMAVAMAVLFIAQSRGWFDHTIWLDGPQSFAVLPMRVDDSTSAEDSLAVALSGGLAWQLNSWDSQVALSPQMLSNLMVELGLQGPFLKLNDALDVARAGGARSLLTVVVNQSGDSLRVSGVVCDVADRCATRLQFPSVGLATELSRLAARVSHLVLGLSGPAEEIEALHAQTASPLAVRSFLSGKNQLASGRLEAAIADLGAAAEADTTFAMAHHYLAVAMYWQVQGTTGADERRAQIGRLTSVAERHSLGLPASQRDHALAFYQFQKGDHDGARSAYQALLERNPEDVYAWLLLGAVECDDPWLEQRSDGSLRPASNLNVAVRAFEKAVELAPDFILGYGHLFDIHRNIQEAIGGGPGWGFRKPGGEPTVPWDIVTPGSMLPFLPVVLDSIIWVTPDELSHVDRERAERGAARLRERSLVLLQRWALYAADDARPHQELGKWKLAERSGIWEPAPPIEIVRITQDALDHTGSALALKKDTLPVDLQLLANLHLGVGDIATASETTDRAIVERTVRTDESWGALTPAVLNVLVATGQPSRALELVGRLPMSKRYIDDPETGGQMATGDAEAVILRLRVLAATGVRGSTTGAELQKLAQRWPDRRYSAGQIQLLKRNAIQRFAPLLVSAEAALMEWAGDVHLADPLWRTMEKAEFDGEAGHAHLEELESSNSSGVPGPERTYILAHAASRAGDGALAIRLFSRLDSLAFDVEHFDLGWGLRSLSFLYRARDYEALGDHRNARDYYERFASFWAGTDSLASGLLDEARQGLERVGRWE